MAVLRNADMGRADGKLADQIEVAVSNNPANTDVCCIPTAGTLEHGCLNIEFVRRKEQILASLDRSPKGSVDAPIVDFLAWLNSRPQIVTTSSCSGRISVFLGSCDPTSSKGGEWLLVSHEILGDAKGAWSKVSESLAARNHENLQGTLVSLLMEPFLLHAECADSETAQHILELAREASFRESGISLGRRRVMVQLRTTALCLQVPLALDGKLIVDQHYFETLVGLANARLTENGRRVQRLWERLREGLLTSNTNRSAAALAAVASNATPWVLVCEQSLARSVKLALEELNWMDESRKMGPVMAGADTANSQTTDADKCALQDRSCSCIGIPVVNAAADFLQSAAALETVASSLTAAAVPGLATAAHAKTPVQAETPASCEASGVEGSSNDAGGKGTKKRPPTKPANLTMLWQCGRLHVGNGERPVLHLRRSDELPRKDRSSQRASEAGTAEHQCLLQALVEVLGSLRSQSDAVAASQEARARLMEEIRNLSPLQWRGDVALFPRGALLSSTWVDLDARAQQYCRGLWEAMRVALGARLLARQREIRVDDEVRGGAIEILAGTGETWVVVPGPRGVRYTFDVTRCMFSEGNAAEKARVAEFNVQGETVLDLYAGVGFWTLPLLAAGAERVFACEWNPDALEALQRGLVLLGEGAADSGTCLADRCTVLAGDNRRSEVRETVAGRCHRAILGLIPFSRDGFAVAVVAMRDVGGLLHLHWNVHCDEEAATARAVAAELETVFHKTRGTDWSCKVQGVQRVKWFAPRIRHVRIDVVCSRTSTDA
mmetsp:Transcript_71611/g.142100  ORF Transcript_71611/g.142100 Transcript_71611/m.142100 type:complete len:782 (+) Transcript_71611:80-2425(+)